MRTLITLIALVGLVSRAYSTFTCYTDLAASAPSGVCDYCYIEYDSNLEITGRGCTASGGTCDTGIGKTCCDTENCNDGTIVACYVGSPDSNADLTDASFCDIADAQYCAITISGTTITARSCEAECVPSATQACCTSNNCNDAVDVSSTCLQTGATEASFVCAVAEPMCTVDFSGDTLEKGCEDYCDYDTEFNCCEGDDCNTATELGSTCLACEDAESCADPVSSPCPMDAADFGGCYTLFYEGAPWYKDCYAADDTVCDDYDDIVCCDDGDDCNDDTEYNSGIMVKSSVSFAVLISALVPIVRNLIN